MFSKVTHILTIVAFNVHTLFGCCGHHQHYFAEHCDLHVEQAIVVDTLLTVKPVNCTAENCNQHLSNYPGGLHSQMQLAFDSVDNKQIPPLHAPCVPARGCSEGQCIFIALSDASVLTFEWIESPLALSATRFASRVELSSNLMIGDSGGRSVSSLPSCALLQSWQI